MVTMLYVEMLSDMPSNMKHINILTFHETKGAASENPKFMPKINGGFLRTPQGSRDCYDEHDYENEGE